MKTLMTTRMKTSPLKAQLSKKRAREEQGDTGLSSPYPTPSDLKKAWKKSKLKTDDIL
jgi:hypothetical protein